MPTSRKLDDKLTILIGKTEREMLADIVEVTGLTISAIVRQNIRRTHRETLPITSRKKKAAR